MAWVVAPRVRPGLHCARRGRRGSRPRRPATTATSRATPPRCSNASFAWPRRRCACRTGSSPSPRPTLRASTAIGSSPRSAASGASRASTKSTAWRRWSRRPPAVVVAVGRRVPQPVAGTRRPMAPHRGRRVQNREENDWHADFSARAGIQLDGVLVTRNLQILLEYFRGHSPNGQFYREKVDYLGLGVHFHFGPARRANAWVELAIRKTPASRGVTRFAGYGGPFRGPSCWSMKQSLVVSQHASTVALSGPRPWCGESRRGREIA